MSDDERYDNRCDKFTNQSLNRAYARLAPWIAVQVRLFLSFVSFFRTDH